MLLGKMRTLSKERAACSVGAVRAGVAETWQERSCPQMSGLPSAQPVLSGRAVSDPLRCCVLFVLVLPSDVSRLSGAISPFHFAVRSFVRTL